MSDEPTRTRWDGQTREQFMAPMSQGGMSMGEGRVIEPEEGFQGTMMDGCPNAEGKNPWGKHRFVCYSNLNSVEFFRCSYGCGTEFSD